MKVDPTSNILKKRFNQLEKMFYPENVAIIGASDRENSVGNILMTNLLNFKGEVYPVNSKRDKIEGKRAYKSIKDVPKKIDLAVIATPAKSVPHVVDECIEAGVSSLIIISAGFKEFGKSGELLENEIKKSIKKSNIRIIGPNCLGIINPINGLNATFAAQMAQPGNIAYLSQSGALCTAVLDWSVKEKIGFSAFVSVGSMIDVGWGDLIDYFGEDPNTKSILIYMESVGDTRSFLSAAREVSLTKPIVLIKAGRTKESAKAAASHTGALSGSDEVLDAALERAGVLRIASISDLFSMTDVFAKQPRPKGPNLAIITNAGGPGVIATDALIRKGGKLAKLSKSTMSALNDVLPPFWSHNNPIDIMGDAGPDLYDKAVRIAITDDNVDGILTILTPQHMTDPEGVADRLKKISTTKKTILASWMGGEKIKKGIDILMESSIPVFPFPDMACRIFSYMWAYSHNLENLYKMDNIKSMHLGKSDIQKRDKLSKLFEGVVKEGRTILDEYQSKEVLEAYDIPSVPTEIAKDDKEAAEIAKKMGFPVALKLYSKTITHKTDVGGVKLDITTAADVKKAFFEIYKSVKKLRGEKHFLGITVQKMIKFKGYELILGSSVDKDFGPVILFGSGGELVEVIKDRALSLPPLDSNLATRLMKKTKIYKALKGFRGRGGVDLDLLQKILIRFSSLISDYPIIEEIDINPLLAGEEGIMALDARVILHKGGAKSFPAIRPYPTEYVKFLRLKNISLKIRPVRPDDREEMVNFLKTFHEKGFFKFLDDIGCSEPVAKERLIHLCFADYDREIVLITEVKSEIVGIAKLSKLPTTDRATFSIVVKNNWQGKGIGTALLKYLVQVSKREKVKTVEAEILKDSIAIQIICKKVGFKLSERDDIIYAKIQP